MLIFAHLFISYSISFKTHSLFKKSWTRRSANQNQEMLPKWATQIHTIYNQLNIWNSIQLVKLATLGRSWQTNISPLAIFFFWISLIDMEILLLFLMVLSIIIKKKKKKIPPPLICPQQKDIFFLFPWIDARKSIYISLMSISYNIRDIIHNVSWP